MKKKLVAILALTLAAVMILASCGVAKRGETGGNTGGNAGGNAGGSKPVEPTTEAQKEESIVGTWLTEMDVADAFLEGIAEGDETLLPYFNHVTFILFMAVEYKEDGTYHIYYDEEASAEEAEHFRGQVIEGLMNYLIDETGLDRETIKSMGIDVEALYDESMADMDMTAGTEMSGRYRYEDGKLYSSQSVDEPVSESRYEIVELDGDTMTLVDLVGGIGMDGVYPMVYHRKK